MGQRKTTTGESGTLCGTMAGQCLLKRSQIDVFLGTKGGTAAGQLPNFRRAARPAAGRRRTTGWDTIARHTGTMWMRPLMQKSAPQSSLRAPAIQPLPCREPCRVHGRTPQSCPQPERAAGTAADRGGGARPPRRADGAARPATPATTCHPRNGVMCRPDAQFVRKIRNRLIGFS